MTKEYNSAIEELYETFAKYPFKSEIEGCPCCVSESDKTTLHTKQLRALEDEDISRFAFKAMTTWGDVNDFKHYLPRIFELLSTNKLVVDTFVVLGKLEYGNWTEWNEEEKQAIVNFLKLWWKEAINNNEYFDPELLIEINKLVKDLPALLNDWNLEIETRGFKNYLELVAVHYYDLKHKNRVFKELKKRELEKLINWIDSNSKKLEDGFFKYDKEDKDLSQRISNTLYMFERTD